MAETPIQANKPHALRICGAKTRSGQPCKSRPMANGRCRMHGGKTPTGLALPQTIHGRYSKNLPTKLAARYEAALKDPDLLALTHEIAITDAQIAELLDELNEDAPANARTRRSWKVQQASVRRGVQSLIAQRRKLVETERKRLVDLQQMMTAEQAMMLLTAVEHIALRWIPSGAAQAGFSADIAALVNHRGTSAADRERV